MLGLELHRVARLVLLMQALLLLAGCMTIHEPQRQPQERPNIVVILFDDLGFGDIGAYGSKWGHTPEIDRLAASGTRYEQFLVASPVCSPSRAAILTGHYPERYAIHQHFSTVEHHQRYGMPDWLPETAPSLARMLQAAGYRTGHFGKWHLTNTPVPDAPTPAAYGFDAFTVFNGPGPRTDAWQVVDDTIAFIAENRDRPFFANVWLHEPHTPHFPDPARLDDFAALDQQQQVYSATIATGDAAVGRILSQLDALGLSDNTIIVLSSDNGPEVTGGSDTRLQPGDPDAAIAGLESLGRYFSVGDTGGLRGRKRDIFEGGIRVPLIIRWPGHVRAGAVDRRNVLSALDLLPTIVDLAGAALPTGYRPDGVSWLPLWRDGRLGRTGPLFWQRTFPRGSGRNGEAWLAARDGQWKLVKGPGAEAQLFDLSKDPAETRDIADANRTLVMQMLSDARKWRESLPQEAPTNAISALRQDGEQTLECPACGR
jgi:N-acetylgalactosamine-6-sulfatase